MRHNGAMPKVDEAQEILKALGLPKAQQSEKAAYTLLALTNMTERKVWRSAAQARVRIHDVIRYAAEVFRKPYAENTREDFRRRVIDQFLHASVVERHANSPNDPGTRYALTENVLRVVRAYGTDAFASEAEAFVAQHGSLAERYAGRKRRQATPVTLPDGTEILLSHGRHNALQAAIVREFAPRFAPGARLLYLGDATQRTLHVDTARLERLGMTLSSHGKLPDVILYDESREWLFFVEAVTSHGPVSPKRHVELEEEAAASSAARVYVTAFPDFKEYKKHVADIAWETEIWIAEHPEHMIHYNGDKFLGPAER
jgi:hypothetical protein